MDANDDDSFDFGPTIFTQRTEDELRALLEVDDDVCRSREATDIELTEEIRNSVLLEICSVDENVLEQEELLPLTTRRGTVLTENSKKDLEPDNKKTAKRYKGYVRDFTILTQTKKDQALQTKLPCVTSFHF